MSNTGSKKHEIKREKNIGIYSKFRFRGMCISDKNISESWNIKVIFWLVSRVRLISPYLIKAINFFCGVNWFIASSTGRIHDGAVIPQHNTTKKQNNFTDPVRSVQAVMYSWETNRPPLRLQAFQLIYGRDLEARRSPAWGTKPSWCLHKQSDIVSFTWV